MKSNESDVTTKELIWEGAADWLARFTTGPIGKVTIIDSNITTMTAEADKVLKVGGRRPYLLVLEPHSYHDRTLLRRLWYRQVALDHRHNLPVLTVLILLRKEADSPGLTGRYERQMPDGWMTNGYNYRVVRLWEEDPETYLNAGISLVPLAPLTNVTQADLPRLIRRMEETIEKEPKPRPGKLWTATNLLMGLRYPKELAAQLLKGKMQAMRESTTYQAILQEGRIEEARKFLLRLGTKQFGPPAAPAVTALERIQDPGGFEVLADRILDPGIQSWDDLLREK